MQWCNSVKIVVFGSTGYCSLINPSTPPSSKESNCPLALTVTRQYDFCGIGKLYTNSSCFLKLKEEIAKERGLQISTLGGHLADALSTGHPVNFRRLNITFDLIDEVEKAVRKPPLNSGK